MDSACGKSAVNFSRFLLSTIFSFSAFKISTGVSTLGMILGSAFIAFKHKCTQRKVGPPK